MSGDNDFSPVLRTIKDLFNIKPFLITPPYEHGVVNLKPIKDLKSACFDKNRKRFNVINLQFNDFVGHSFPERIHDPLRKLDLEMPKEYSKF